MFLRIFLAGYVACLVTIAAVGMLAKVISCERDFVGINTVSHHFNPAHEYNERNWGAFYECRNGSLGLQTGYYRNSFYKDTLYLVGIYQPLTLGPVDLGGFIGPATGYSKNLVLIAGAVVTLNVTKEASVQAIVAPSVAGLQLKWAW